MLEVQRKENPGGNFERVDWAQARASSYPVAGARQVRFERVAWLVLACSLEPQIDEVVADDAMQKLTPLPSFTCDTTECCRLVAAVCVRACGSFLLRVRALDRYGTAQELLVRVCWLFVACAPLSLCRGGYYLLDSTVYCNVA